MLAFTLDEGPSGRSLVRLNATAQAFCGRDTAEKVEKLAPALAALMLGLKLEKRGCVHRKDARKIRAVECVALAIRQIPNKRYQAVGVGIIDKRSQDSSCFHHTCLLRKTRWGSSGHKSTSSLQKRVKNSLGNEITLLTVTATGSADDGIVRGKINLRVNVVIAVE